LYLSLATNRVPVNKIFLEQNSIEPKVKVFITMYKLLEVTRCEKCGKVTAKPKELVRIVDCTFGERRGSLCLRIPMSVVIVDLFYLRKMLLFLVGILSLL